MNKYELTLYDYWRIIRRRRVIFFLIMTSVITATGIFTALQTPIYEATCTLRIAPSLSIPGASLEVGWDPWTEVNTEVKVIKGSEVSELAAEKLGLIKPGMSREEQEKASAAIRGSINATRESESNIIRISITADDPKKALLVANTVVEAYIQRGIENKNRKAREMREFIGVQLKEAENKLTESENEMKAFLLKSKTKGLGSSLVDRLMTLEEERSILLKTYTQAHPNVSKIDDQIKAVKNRMQLLPADELEHARITRKVNLNEKLYLVLAERFKEAQISEAEREYNAFPVSRATLPASPIYPNVPLNMIIGTGIAFFLGILVAFVVENLDTSIGNIEDVEVYLQLPVLGVIPHISLEDVKGIFYRMLEHLFEWIMRAKHFSSRHTISTLFKDDALNITNKRSGIERRSIHDRRGSINEMRGSLVVFQPNGSPFIEAYHSMRTNIQWKLPNPGGKILLFTSAGVGEGKTITSCNFALAAARTGLKTLLIDSDLRKPMIGRLFGLSHDPGLTNCIFTNTPWNQVIRGTSDFLMGELALEQLVKTPGIENFFIMTCGMTTPNPIDILNTKNLGTVLKILKDHFDLIILDCPPVLLFADALILGQYADASVLIYQAGRMAREALKRTKEQLVNSHIPVLGVVLNNLHALDMEPRYGYYYSSYYSKEDKSNQKRKAA